MSAITTEDQLQNKLEIQFPPQRIVSLVPSQTEFLFDIGLDEQITGITRFCIHPAEKVKTKPKIGGTKQFDLEKIKSLEPDLIIGNKEENYEEGISELQKHFSVWMSDIYTLQDSFAMMREVSRIAGAEREGEELVKRIETEFQSLPVVEAAKTAAYFIWRKPYMVAAQHTFIDHMLGVYGVSNVFGNLTRYPEINPEELGALKPDLIFLSSEPYRFAEKHLDEFRNFSPGAKVILVDGELFSWYGSRLLHSASYFKQLRSEIGL